MSIQLSYQDIPDVQKNKWIIFVSIVLFTFMATLDGSIVNIALPSIAKSLHVKTNKAIWIIAFYMMSICVLLIFFGKLGDIVGKIKIFRIGTIVFVLGSILSGFANSLEQLILCRVFQAVGSSMTMSSNLGIITEIFSNKDRGKALGFIGSAVSLGTIIGPSVGGIIVEHLSWPYIFWINAPFGILTIFLGIKYLPKDIIKTKTKIDVIGFLLYALFIICFFGAMFLAQEIGFNKAIIIVLLSLSLMFLIIFIKVELSKKMPLLNLNIFKNRKIRIGLICAFVVFSTNFLFYILMPFYLQNARGFSASHAGLLVMVFPMVMVITSPIVGGFIHKIGAEKLTIFGLIVLTISHGLLIFIKTNTSIYIFLILVAMLGFGNSLFQPPNNTLIMSSANKDELGVVGSLNALSRNIGNMTGIAFSTTILFAAMSYKLGSHVSTYLNEQPEVFIFGLHVTFIASFMLLLITTLLSVYSHK